jgi:hypothetical protein
LEKIGGNVQVTDIVIQFAETPLPSGLEQVVSFLSE